MTATKKTAADLKQLVKSWVNDTFNFIQKDLLETYLQTNHESLIEYIRPLAGNLSDALGHCHETREELEALADGDLTLEWLEENMPHEFNSYREEIDRDNYPMWNTLFEFRWSPSEEIVEAAQAAGFGVIEETDQMKLSLFVAGAGYSFYGHHWIPLYLSIYPETAKEFSHLSRQDIQSQ